MRWSHPDHPDRALRLGYCLNLHPADDLDGLLEGLARVALPLRDRLAPGAELGVGPWLPAQLAARLASKEGDRDLRRLVSFLAEERLSAFTFNAFPFGAFHESGLKRRVFRPSWATDERLRFTLDVARVASACGVDAAHLSISTHTGGWGSDVADDAARTASARNLARCAAGLARIEDETGYRTVLALEPEPGANCGTSAELAAWRASVLEQGTAEAPREVLERHLGACLDACHSAVELEPPGEALAAVLGGGSPLGKLQFTSALALRDPGADAAARERLLALAEPRYLHQVRAVHGDLRLEVDDLPDLARALEDSASPWLAAPEWRCHFHVPVDLGALDESADADADAEPGGLRTTRPHADALLERLLADPDAWNVDELHVEIETYTWDVLPASARRAGDPVDGLEREWRHVMAVLERAGWIRA